MSAITTDVPQSLVSIANAVSSNGSVVVGDLDIISPAFDDAFRWTQQSGTIELGFDRASDVSADGSVVVGSDGAEAVRWTAAGGIVGLGRLTGGVSSGATAVSQDGSVVVGFSDSVFGPEAFYWMQELGTINLRTTLISSGVTNLAGWTNLFAEDVSADGTTIVGHGRNPAGNRQAWIATIPEPSTLVLATLLVIGGFSVGPPSLDLGNDRIRISRP